MKFIRKFLSAGGDTRIMINNNDIRLRSKFIIIKILANLLGDTKFLVLKLCQVQMVEWQKKHSPIRQF